MPMRVLLIGQCTLHIGRMEFGNIGNYYIIEPFVRELHRCLPGAEIRTTLQMSDAFCERERVTRLSMDRYYGWCEHDGMSANRELALAEEYRRTGKLARSTPYLEEVMAADLVIDFSGDIWGDNADFLGPDRFRVGLCKNRTAQLLGKPTAMLAGSPGPFGNPATSGFAREVFAGFDLVTNREPVSRRLLEHDGFDTARLVDLACPAFLFEPERGDALEAVVRNAGLTDDGRPLVGFILCGWNFTCGPFDRWPRSDAEYDHFVTAVEHIVRRLGARVCLMSHANGFRLPAPPFMLTHGRDHPIAVQLLSLLERRGLGRDVFVLDGVHGPARTKALIGRMDMLVSGRVHAAVAGLSQHVPTVLIDYGHPPKAHKIRGFAEVAGVADLVVDPADRDAMVDAIDRCWREREAIVAALEKRMPSVRAAARANFEHLASLAGRG